MRNWLKDIRDSKGYTQQHMANLLGVTVQQYNFIANGKRQQDLNLSTASKLSDIFEIPLSTIRNYEEALRGEENAKE